MQELALKLIAKGANQECVDRYDHKAFYYLSCSDEEKRDHIKTVLDSVNFFYGRYFDENDRERVTQALLGANRSLQEALGATSQKGLNRNVPRR